MELDKNNQEQGVIDSFQQVRRQTLALTEGLSAEDMVVQSMPDASPLKWHLAHTSWFYEHFILQRFSKNYQCFNTDYQFLFNSYYDAVGPRHARPNRGLLTRPAISDILEYRQHVETHMQQLLALGQPDVTELLTIGLHHEMQHQELMLTDVLHLLSANPLAPAMQQTPPPASLSGSAQPLPALQMLSHDGGLLKVGAAEQGFSYDCEKPRHQYFLQPFKLASRPVTNGEWLQFIDDGGYQNPLLWLSDGWHYSQQYNWQAPLYWQRQQQQWCSFSLRGLQPLNLAAPVCHISYYEADAFARWAGKRLPREQEWEVIAEAQPEALTNANFLEQHIWQPTSCDNQPGFQKLFGDVWEWSQSPYSPYPGFSAAQGELAEYNGKFMANQFVLRGGSCASPRQQLRSSYRNFFHPHQRWQFSGLRLAEDQ
ncbi:ergothioneine biosynthesis protein EgtB [Arsukibacterium indicum]|uniref:Ergothioneine biosynthesis protein EgtB n=1 Tax=Arsukibacterium indicum TaxID=2848612 RepID=A0ABS6MI99_9GAMM|nr:ergothioneine biosynthesis protein EgtB [Arsukibacterium indicum]MBV2128538.1 ergothioneine biosynthesis protein EgtB [Arsukibacterium indicum]